MKREFLQVIQIFRLNPPLWVRSAGVVHISELVSGNPLYDIRHDADNQKFIHIASTTYHSQLLISDEQLDQLVQ